MSRDPADLWSTMEHAIVGHHVRPLVAALTRLEDAERKALVPHLKAFARSDEHGTWHLSGGLAMAGAAILPDAKTVAAWLRRHNLSDHVPGPHHRESVDLHAQVVEVLIARDPSWLGRLVELVLERQRFNQYDAPAYWLVERLRAHLDLDPPTAPAYVAGWATHDWLRSSYRDPAGGLRERVRWGPVVPLVFEHDDLAHSLRDRAELLPAVLELQHVDRAAVLDTLLARLQRGGRPQATNDLVAVHAALGTTLAEVEQRRRDHVALLSGTASTVAALAQAELFRLADADRLPAELLLESSVAVFQRSEKKVLRAQLARLRAHARARPGDVPVVVRALAAALLNPAADVQRDAVRVLVELAITDAERAILRDAAALLPPDLMADLAPVLGASDPTDAPAPAPAPATTLTVPEPRPVVPIDSVEELVEEFLVLLRGEGWTMDGIAVERVLEALPRLAGTDADGIRRRAEPVLSDPMWGWSRDLHEYLPNTTLRRGLVALLAAATGEPIAVHAAGDGRTRDGALQLAVTRRAYAAAAALRRAPRVRVVALPSRTTGAIDPDALLTRLRTAAEEGWEPDHTDLEQALLRTRATDPAPFAALGSEAGRRAAAWFTGPLPEAGTRLVRLEVDDSWHQMNFGEYREPTRQTMAETVPSAAAPDSLWALVGTWSAPARWFGAGWDPDAAFLCWPLALPHHRDVGAAHLLPELSRARQSRIQGAPALLTLVEGDGPVGEALLAACCYALSAKHADTRAVGVDAVLVLVARGQLDGVGLGAVLGRLVLGKDVSLKAVVPALRDVAQAGAARPAWDAVRTALEAMLAEVLEAGGTVPGLPDVLVLATETAALADGHDPVAGLAVLAGRSGSSRQVTEARRLLAVLG